MPTFISDKLNYREIQQKINAIRKEIELRFGIYTVRHRRMMYDEDFWVSPTFSGSYVSIRYSRLRDEPEVYDVVRFIHRRDNLYADLRNIRRNLTYTHTVRSSAELMVIISNMYYTNHRVVIEFKNREPVQHLTYTNNGTTVRIVDENNILTIVRRGSSFDVHLKDNTQSIRTITSIDDLMDMIKEYGDLTEEQIDDMIKNIGSI